ncbi:hypothetical protein BRARA_A03011 [Brassica rapa]|uniref:Pectinesterase inhibitor domain-containing protein n=1 Tax=Brassica campestris TaxID=3711 RepID=A0A398AXI4_BRACM|nr:hypothetical protein BRARA_A03011 [Brassica rapa]
MATNMMNKYVLVLSCLIFFVMIGSLIAKPADIKAIYGKAKNPSFCTNYMKSNPKTSGADIKTLATITLDSAQTSASGALNKITPFSEKEPKRALRSGYVLCVQSYRSTIRYLGETKKSLASGDVPGQNINVSDAMRSSTYCQDEMLKVKGDPSVVKDGGDFQNICSIVLVISKMMM